MGFSLEDEQFMKLALDGARQSLLKNNYPISAVLVIDGNYVDQKSNTLFENKDWSSHAESMLIREHATLIKEQVKEKKSLIEVYTTLEPCLMCLGTMVLSRVSRIVYASPDPVGGVSHIDPNTLSFWYQSKWPRIEGMLFKEESYDLLIKFMHAQQEKSEIFLTMVPAFEAMHASWK